MMTSQSPVTDHPASGVRDPAAESRLAGVWAERAWRAGDRTAAIEAADRVLAAGDDPGCLAAGVAAAAAAADGSLADAAERWRCIAGTVGGPPGALAGARAALAAALIGDLAAAERGLCEARELVAGVAPRGLTVFFDAVGATGKAVRGEFDTAARQLAGLAVATVPADPMAAEQWDELAVAATMAGGDDRTAADMLAAYRDRPATPRRTLLASWVDLRVGRLADARAGLANAATEPILRRDAVLAAAITVGLARRSGNEEALRSTWFRVAPVVAGADVELLLLDAWGELSVGAALVAPVERDTVVAAMTDAVTRAGRPSWAAAALVWWAVQRAVVTDDPAAAERAVADAPHIDRFAARLRVATLWASMLTGTSGADAAAIREAALALADAGQPWEAATFCASAAQRSTAASARDLLAIGRSVRATIAAETRAAAGGLSTRERSVGALLLDGLTQKEIGARLYISPKTVEQHVARLRQKLLAGNRAELVAALRARLAD